MLAPGPAKRVKALSDDDYSLSPDEQESLIERVKAGEVDLFVELVRPLEQSIRLISCSILHNDADAEEIVQETLLKALAHLNQLRAGQCFKGWLLQIAVNEARMRLRRDRIYQREPTGTAVADPGAEPTQFVPRDLADCRELPSLALERKELWAAVHRALGSIDPIYREVFVLRDMQHLTVSQTAVILRIGETSVTTRLHRARLLMREQLAPLFRRPAQEWVPSQRVLDMAHRYIKKTMSYKKVAHELSKYMDQELDRHLRAEIEEHLKFCRRCTILIDSTRRLLYIVGDDRVFMPPFDCSHHWTQVLSESGKTA